MSYTIKSFYVSSDDVETLHEFQDKCKTNGAKSYSKVLIALMRQYNKRS
tara:strand:- start:703 stop:849 length:147 start_codon:yes stop_codon:yes gene_type:complete